MEEELAEILHEALLEAEQRQKEVEVLPRYLPLPDWMIEILEQEEKACE